MKQKYILYDNTNNYEMRDEIRRKLFQDGSSRLEIVFFEKRA